MASISAGIHNTLISIKDKLKSDDMTRHGLMMAGFGLFAGFLNYLYQFFMGTLLTPRQFGTLYTLLSLFSIILVISQIYQNSVTKFTSRFRALNYLGQMNSLWRFFLRRTALIGAAAFAVLALLSPLISKFLNIANNWYLIILFSSFALAVVIAANYGILRGLQRFLALGLSQTIWASLRLAAGVVLVYLGFAIYGALLALLISYLIVFVITMFFLRDLSRTSKEKPDLSGLGSYTGFTFLAIASYSILTNADAILAKHYLNPESAGNYAVISLLGSVARFAPAGVAMAMFPKTAELFEMGRRHSKLLMRAILLTLIMVSVVVILYGLFPDFIINFFFGSKYPFVAPYLFEYGLAMLFFTLSWLLMNYFLSVNETKVAYPFMGVMLLQISLICFFHSSIAQIVNIFLISGILSFVLILPFFWKMKKYPAKVGPNSTSGVSYS